MAQTVTVSQFLSNWANNSLISNCKLKRLSYDSVLLHEIQPYSAVWTLQSPSGHCEDRRTHPRQYLPMASPQAWSTKTTSRLCSSLQVRGQETNVGLLDIRYSGNSEGSQDSTCSISVPLEPEAPFKSLCFCQEQPMGTNQTPQCKGPLQNEIKNDRGDQSLTQDFKLQIPLLPQ